MPGAPVRDLQHHLLDLLALEGLRREPGLGLEREQRVALGRKRMVLGWPKRCKLAHALL